MEALILIISDITSNHRAFNTQRPRWLDAPMHLALKTVPGAERLKTCRQGFQPKSYRLTYL